MTYSDTCTCADCKLIRRLRATAPNFVRCDRCDDESNSASELMCGRVDEPGEQPCTGTYREAS